MPPRSGADVRMERHGTGDMTLLELLTLLKKHLKLVIALPVACVVVMALYSTLFMQDTYTATTDMYVLASSQGEGTSQALSSDLTASQMLTNDVASLLKSDRVMSGAAKDLYLENLNDYDISVTSETTTRVISLSVTGPEAQGAANVANALAGNVSQVAQDVMDVESVNVIDEAPVPTEPSGPNRKLYVAVAALGGLFVAVAIVVVMDMLNTRVRGVDDLEQLLELPVIGRIPEFKERR